MRLLIVDDSQILCERLEAILAEIDKVRIVGQAGDSREAVESVKNLKPDIVVLDIRLLEGGNGIFVLKEIKKLKNPPIVIMFTNFPYLQYRKMCLDAGADYFFYKSLEFEKLVNLIKELERAQKQKKNKKYSS